MQPNDLYRSAYSETKFRTPPYANSFTAQAPWPTFPFNKARDCRTPADEAAAQSVPREPAGNHVPANVRVYDCRNFYAGSGRHSAVYR
jgi:hypothetical protein